MFAAAVKMKRGTSLFIKGKDVICTAPFFTLVSVGLVETIESYDFANSIESLLSTRLEAPIILPAPLGSDQGAFATLDFSQRGYYSGDCHANGARGSNVWAGEMRCFRCSVPAKLWLSMLLMSRSVWLEKEKSLTQNQELFCNGKVEDAASMGYRSLAALLLSNPETKVSDLFLSEHFLATDYMLHHRTGAFKIYVWWAVLNSNNLSAKELELLRRAFESATKYKTWMEYMDGKRWLHVALQWEKIFIGLSIEMFHFRNLVL